MHAQDPVFYTALGHREDVWSSTTYQSLLLAAIQWTVGRNITGKAPGEISREQVPESGTGAFYEAEEPGGTLTLPVRLRDNGPLLQDEDLCSRTVTPNSTLMQSQR